MDDLVSLQALNQGIFIHLMVSHAYIETRKPAVSGVSGDADVIDIRDCGFDCHWYGYVHRAANIRIDDNLQNYFGSSMGAAIAYLTNGVTLSGGCSGIVHDVSNTVGVSFNGSGCGKAQPTALQQGALFSEVGFDTGGTHNSVMTFTYKLF